MSAPRSLTPEQSGNKAHGVVLVGSSFGATLASWSLSRSPVIAPR
jgi:hypothetical protein